MQTWGDIVYGSLGTIWTGFVGFIPNFVGALIVFLIGMIIAVGLGKLVRRLIGALMIDVLLEKMGFKAPLEKAGMRLDSGYFVGELVKWFLIIAFVLASADILGLSTVTAFLGRVLFYVPNIIVAVLILLAALMVANFLEKFIKAIVLASNLTHATFLATVAKWSVLIFAIFAALIQLGVAPTLLNTLFTGFVAMMAIGGGVAFGLGGKEYAGELIGLLKKNITKE